MHHFRHRTQEPSVLAALTMRKLGKGKGRDLMLSSRILGSTILIKGNWPHTPRQRKLRWRGICKDLQRSACWQVQIYFAEPSYEGYQKKKGSLSQFLPAPQEVGSTEITCEGALETVKHCSLFTNLFFHYRTASIF